MTSLGWDYIKLYNGTNPKPGIYVTDLLNQKLLRYKKVPTTTVAQAVSLEGAKKLLHTRSVFFRPVDVDIQYYWENDLRVYGLAPYAFRLLDRVSDIQAFGKRRGARKRKLFALKRKFTYSIAALYASILISRRKT